MAQGLELMSFPATKDLSTGQFKLVKLNTSGKIDVNVTAGGRVDGVLMDKPAAADRPAAIQPLDGSSEVEVIAGDAVAYGALLTSDASGRAKTATAAQHIFGLATSTGSTDKFVKVLLGYRGTV